MTWKSYIPLYGKRSVRKKVSELESEGKSLPVIFGVLVTKIFEALVMLNFTMALKFTIGSLVVSVIFIYRQEAKEKAEEVKEEVTEGE